jgi:hypothetical protein
MAGSPKDTEIRFTVDSSFLGELQKRLGIEKGTDIARAALTLLDWASKETQSGRIVLSSNESGKDVHRLVMPELVRRPVTAGSYR